MKRKHKLYSNPKKPFDKLRIEEEQKIKEEFGLKNKKEIWKSEAKVKLMREKAKNLIKSSSEKQKVFFDQLNKIGIKTNSLTDTFTLDTKNYLERRLQTIVFRKGLVNTINESRQKIVHKKVLVDGKIINKPSYLVPVELENKITIKVGKEQKGSEINFRPHSSNKELSNEGNFSIDSSLGSQTKTEQKTGSFLTSSSSKEGSQTKTEQKTGSFLTSSSSKEGSQTKEKPALSNEVLKEKNKIQEKINEVES